MRTRSDLADRVKEALSARTVGERYGLTANHAGYAHCPFHGEKTPSMKLYDAPGKGFHCFGCGAGGSVIDLVMRIANLPFRMAVMRLATDFGIVGGMVSARPAPNTRKRREGEYTALCKELWELDALVAALAPATPHDEWTDAWCAAMDRQVIVEAEIMGMEAEGFGRPRTA